MKSKKLYCFTYAGGTASFFDVIKNDLEGIEVVGLEYAGHGTRHKENFYLDFDELSCDCIKQIKRDYNGEEYALFGYSMGSIALVETLKKIIDSGMNLPANLFLAGHEPQTKSELLGYSADELDEWVKERTIRFGAVPERLLNNKVFWRTYLPLYRADYTIIGKYNFKLPDSKTEIPATIFYSEEDTKYSDMLLWSYYYPCEFFRFTGNHFFIMQHHEKIAKIIKEKMGVLG